MHAIDKQEMADSIQFGVVPVADSFFSPRSRSYARSSRRSFATPTIPDGPPT